MDILKGAFGKLLEIVFTLTAFGMIIGGLFEGVIGIVLGGVFFGCLAFGVRYWLGHIVRVRR